MMSICMLGGSHALKSSCWQKHCHLGICQERKDNCLDQHLNQKIKIAGGGKEGEIGGNSHGVIDQEA